MALEGRRMGNELWSLMSGLGRVTNPPSWGSGPPRKFDSVPRRPRVTYTGFAGVRVWVPSSIVRVVCSVLRSTVLFPFQVFKLVQIKTPNIRRFRCSARVPGTGRRKTLRHPYFALRDLQWNVVVQCRKIALFLLSIHHLTLFSPIVGLAETYPRREGDLVSLVFGLSAGVRQHNFGHRGL